MATPIGGAALLSDRSGRLAERRLHWGCVSTDTVVVIQAPTAIQIPDLNEAIIKDLAPV
jgi:hypothetical protein